MFFKRCRSRINGARLLIVITRDSKNTKTGPMLQVWILARDGEAKPQIANCGTCPRGLRFRRGRLIKRCYVRWHRAPLAILRAYRRGSYEGWLGTPDQLRRLGGPGQAVRLGAAGDPGAIPSRLLRRLVADLEASCVTSYTRRWRDRNTKTLQNHCMASCDSSEEAREAQDLGWRTFRARRPSELVLATEAVCPASKEGGERTTCERCRACTGGDRTTLYLPDRTIVEH